MARKWVVLLALLTAGVLLVGVAAANEAPRIGKEGVKAKLNSPEVTIIDVRAPRDWKKSDSMIKGAVREDPREVEKWAKNYPKGKTLVLYCAWPSEGTSASVALKLKGMGYDNVYALKGGWNEWEAADYPTEKKREKSK